MVTTFAGGGDVNKCIGGKGNGSLLEVSLFSIVVYSYILFIPTHNLLNASAGRYDNGNSTIMPDVCMYVSVSGLEGLPHLRVYQDHRVASES